ncbi:hypothetical protein BN14_07940 [Rhizoctonia solani AG-1 IB]|uniref:Uncharacterized protein n=1 Tax=Thanatephorus cucumeris (strain AG1-IB / isolate 7/3/14) TaxID=1108050 RepID=M5C3C6_THACB|nr:hypothetical protein BN14_07940 [Rhizoctonia solani AG-1 IB]
MPAKHNTTNSNPQVSKSSRPACEPRQTRGFLSRKTPTATAPLPGRLFCSTPPRLSQSITDTPSFRSSAGAIRTLTKSTPASYTHKDHQSLTAGSKAHQQSAMELQLEDELRDVIFHDPKFIDHFLAGDNDKLTKIVKHCRKQDQQLKRKKKWSIPARVSDEKELYAPVLKVLNTIKKAVDDVHGSPEALPQVSNQL